MRRRTGHDVSAYPSVDESGEGAALASHVTDDRLRAAQASDFSQAGFWQRKQDVQMQFSFEHNTADGAVLMSEQLAELSADRPYINTCGTKPLIQCWISPKKDFPSLAAKANEDTLLPVATIFRETMHLSHRKKNCPTED